MSILADITEDALLEPVAVRCTDTDLVVTLKGGQSIVNALTNYPRLLHGSPQARAHVELSPFGVHWPELDEDLSIRGLLKGNAAPGGMHPATYPALSSENAPH